MNLVPNTWMDRRALAVLATASALPGEPVTTRELAERIAARFGVDLTRRALALGRHMNIQRRHLARDFAARREGTRPGDGNADLAARAVRAALDEAGLRPSDLAYLIGHTTTPGEPLPSSQGSPPASCSTNSGRRSGSTPAHSQCLASGRKVSCGTATWKLVAHPSGSLQNDIYPKTGNRERRGNPL